MKPDISRLEIYSPPGFYVPCEECVFTFTKSARLLSFVWNTFLQSEEERFSFLSLPVPHSTSLLYTSLITWCVSRPRYPSRSSLYCSCTSAHLRVYSIVSSLIYVFNSVLLAPVLAESLPRLCNFIKIVSPK